MDGKGKAVSVKNAEHYKWGQQNDGWHLLRNADLSVIEECMGPGKSEQLHFHQKAQQLFYILSGNAAFKLGAELFHLIAGETMHAPPGIVHNIANSGTADLHFIVISSPASQGDRIDIE